MSSLIDIATEIVDETISQSNEEVSRTIFLVGSKSVGKTSLLYNFLEKSDAPKSTLVLDYSFARKTTQKEAIQKSICHVWEYGGKLEMLKNVLISIPAYGGYYFCIMLDLSKIKTIWNILETCFQAIRENYSGKSDNMPEILIIGGKYDLFKNYESELKKFICTTIRSVALVLKAHVLFYSSKESQLVRKTKDTFHSMGFGNGLTIKDKNTNYTKPLLIPNTADSWESIGIPPSTIEQIKLRYIARVPQESKTEEIPTCALQRTHPEPILDSLVALKYEELRNLEMFDPAIEDCLTYLK